MVGWMTDRKTYEKGEEMFGIIPSIAQEISRVTLKENQVYKLNFVDRLTGVLHFYIDTHPDRNSAGEPHLEDFEQGFRYEGGQVIHSNYSIARAQKNVESFLWNFAGVSVESLATVENLKYLADQSDEFNNRKDGSGRSNIQWKSR
jgi:hypothetical protein